MSRNQLDQETSPYLLQHKDNPVHWYSWGPEALAAAEASGKPILLSIGYTACHWCHVMNRESFSDVATAAKMNDLYINVIVDREERPDLDQLYQAAANNMGSQGGWPLTMFLTPKGAPFFTGGYFPIEGRQGAPAFKSVLDDVIKLYREQAEGVASTSLRITEQLNVLWHRDAPGQLDTNTIDTAAMRVAQRFDIFFGGVTAGSKFPNPPLVEMLWRAFLRTGTQQFVQLMSTTLDHMLLGGLFDHVGGGFYRYTADERWILPHFEKMITDNAALIDLMVSVWQSNRNAICEQRIEETITWLMREMKLDDAFASNLDADLDGEQGKYYMWSEAEIDAALQGTFAQKFKAAYNVTHDGNLLGRNALHRLGSSAPFPQSPADEALLKRQREILLAVRQQRTAPMRDDKVLADANGMIIAALANAGAAMKRVDWTTAAVRAFDFIVKALGDGNRLAHSWHGGKRGHAGFSDDYAHMTRAALALWEATGESRFLEKAKQWVHALNENFWNESMGGYYMTSNSDDALIVRPRPIFDQSQPPANAIMIGALARLHMITADVAYSQRANRLVQAFAGESIRAFISAGSFFNNLEIMANELQIVVVGPVNNAKTHELVDAVLGRSVPNKLLLVVSPSQPLPQGHPAFGKDMENGQPTAYICQRRNCSAPITNPVTLSQVLQLPVQAAPPGTLPQ